MLIRDKKMADKIAENGYKRITENFSIEKVADKIWKAYSE